MKITRAKSFAFLRPDGEFVDVDVPLQWNQGLVGRLVRSEYTVRLVVADHVPAEAEFCKVAVGSGPTIGYAIPGSAVLSPDSPHSADPIYCAYNLLIADAVCRASMSSQYELAGDKQHLATSREGIFQRDAFYLITWDKHLPSPQTFARDFAVSLCAYGLVFPTLMELPSELMTSLVADGSTIRLKSTANLPDFVITILGSLVPYCKNPFLRFFYLYQVVEYLMGEDFDARVADVRTRLLGNANPSKVELRDILEKFQDATREKARINKVLSPECPRTLISADSLLSSLGVNEPTASFAERVYRVRNTIFHDYGVLHSQGAAVASVCQHFYAYLVGKKILA